MTLGMSTVFIFLGVLVAATSVMSKVVAKVSPAPAPAPVKRRPSAANTIDPRTRKAIELAVARYRKEH